MTKKQRRLREKRRSEIRSKKLKRIGQSLNARYGKHWKAKFGLRFVKKYQKQILTGMQICPILMFDAYTSRWFHTTEARIVSVMNQYNKLQERLEASLEGS